MGGIKYFLLVVLVVVSGFAGGIFSDRFLPTKAQATNDNQNKVTAQAFHLVDEKGNLRGGLGFSKDGHPAVLFNNPSGKPMAYFGVVNSTPIIEFMDEEGKGRLSLSLGQNGSPHIFFTDDNNKPKMVLAINRNREAGITLHDNENVARMAFLVQGKEPRIAFIEGKKAVDMLLTTRPDGQGGMVMQNKHGQIILGMYNDAPVLMLKKGDKTESMSGFTPAGEPFFALRKDGKTAWVAPQGKKAEVESIDPAADWQSITDTLLKQPKF